VKNTGRKRTMAKIESENEHQMSSISESLGKAIILKPHDETAYDEV
jgi:hypothetical protein